MIHVIQLSGKKYPQVDMVDLQKQKLNSSKVRRILNSFKNASYRSTNTIYRPLDFIYSPTLLVYVIILGGLWFTNGLTDSMEINAIKNALKDSKEYKLDFYHEKTMVTITVISASVLAIIFAVFKFGRKLLVFSAYLVIESCLLGSLIAMYNKQKDNSNDKELDQEKVALVVLYYVCKFASYFGYIFIILMTAELFPTSLR